MRDAAAGWWATCGSNRPAPGNVGLVSFPGAVSLFLHPCKTNPHSSASLQAAASSGGRVPVRPTALQSELGFWGFALTGVSGFVRTRSPVCAGGLVSVPSSSRTVGAGSVGGSGQQTLERRAVPGPHSALDLDLDLARSLLPNSARWAPRAAPFSKCGRAEGISGQADFKAAKRKPRSALRPSNHVWF